MPDFKNKVRFDDVTIRRKNKSPIACPICGVMKRGLKMHIRLIHTEIGKENLKKNIHNLRRGSRKEDWTFTRRKTASDAHIGNRGYWLGKTLSNEHRQKLSESHLGKTMPMADLGARIT